MYIGSFRSVVLTSRETTCRLSAISLNGLLTGRVDSLHQNSGIVSAFRQARDTDIGQPMSADEFEGTMY